MPSIFITGPVRSGKSRFAERLALERGGEIVYVATARIDPDDAEWSARLEHHAARRPQTWRTIETARPGAPPLETLVREARASQTLLIDSFGTWLAAQMGPDTDVAALDARALALADTLIAGRAQTIVVGEEAGWGIVPAYPAGRIFRDVLGRAQQRLAAGSDRAYLVVAGFALDLREHGRPVSDV